MTLHQAIEQVLNNIGKPMSAKEIADIINEKELYTRKDEKPLKAGQITARVSAHPKLFRRENKKISVIKGHSLSSVDLTGLSLKNFKGFGEKDQEIPIKPITLIFGENSSGKSTIIHSLLYQAETIKRNHLDIHTTELSGDVVDLGGLKNIRHKKQFCVLNQKLTFETNATALVNYSRTIDFGNALQNKEGKYSFSIDSSIRLPRLDSPDIDPNPVLFATDILLENQDFVSIKYNTQLKKYHLQSLNTEHPIIAYLISSLIEKLPSNKLVDSAEKINKMISDGIGNWFIQYDGIFPRFTFTYDLLEDATKGNIFLDIINDLLNHLVFCARTYLDKILYLGPFREYPERHFSSDTIRNDSNWSAKGGDCWDKLINEPDLRHDVNKWLSEKSKIASNYSWNVYPRLGPDAIERILIDQWDPNAWTDDGLPGEDDENTLILKGEDEYGNWISKLRDSIEDSNLGSKELRLYDNVLNVNVSHREVGVGLSQVMPVIVNALANKNQQIMIEEPEIHIHPKLQAELGDLFVQSAMGINGNAFILETHSEHLILRLLKIIRKGGIEVDGEKIPFTNKDLSVLSVVKRDGESKVIPIRISSKGEFLDPWPGGFFETDYEERFLEG